MCLACNLDFISGRIIRNERMKNKRKKERRKTSGKAKETSMKMKKKKKKEYEYLPLNYVMVNNPAHIF